MTALVDAWADGPLKREVERLEAENAKLRDALKELVVGTHAEMCADRGMWRCRECVMYHGDESCAVADAMELLEIDTYGNPLGFEVPE